MQVRLEAASEFVGFRAGAGSTTGTRNQFVGYEAAQFGSASFRPHLYLSYTGLAGSSITYISTTALTSTLTVNGTLSIPDTDTGNATSFTTNAHQTLRRTISCTSISIPQAGTCPGRLYIIINANGTGSSVALAVQTSGSIYDDVTGSFISSLPPSNRINPSSDGTNWIVVGR